MAEQHGLTTEFTPWTGRIGADTVVSPTAAHLVRILPLTGFEERGIKGELELGDQITQALNEIARSSKGYGRRRPNDPSNMYREVKLIAVRVPTPTRPPRDQHPVLAARQRPWLEGIERTLPLAAMSVKLRQATMWSGRNLTAGLRHGASAIATGTITAASIEKDRARMMSACAQARCTTPTQEEWQTLVGWYNQGGTANPPILFHHDHVHVFTHSGLQDLDYLIRRGEVGTRSDCHDWPGDLDGHYCMAIGSIVSVTGVNAQEGFDASSVELPVLDERVGWVTEVFNMGALAAVSSFLLEPGKIVAKGLEDNRERIDQDINRDYQKGKWGKAEYEAQLKAADAARDYYATGGHAAAIQVSSLVAMPVEWPWHQGFDWEDMSHRAGATFAPIETPFMVRKAFAEMQLAAETRVAPQPGEVGTEWLGYSKFSACETGGEKKGIYLGRSVGDDQPVWLDLDASFDSEALPLHLLAAGSGFGKALSLDAPIPVPPCPKFPSGWATMGELAVGDRVWGRDGKPCQVTWVSDIDETLELFDVEFDDGQVVRACADHQWTVSTLKARTYIKSRDRAHSIELWDQAQRDADMLEASAAGFRADDESSLPEMHSLVAGAGVTRWNQERLRQVLDRAGCGFREVVEVRTRKFDKEIRKTDPVKLWPTAATVQALRDHWQATLDAGGGNVVRWGADTTKRRDACDRVLAGEMPDEATIREIRRMLIAEGAPPTRAEKMSKDARAAGLEPRDGWAEVVSPRTGDYDWSVNSYLYPTAVGLKALAAFIREQAGERPSDTIPDEITVTTKEMLERGLFAPSQGARFAIRMAEPVEGVEADLPLDPYIFGAWLGDGHSAAGRFTQAVGPASTDISGVTDKDHLLAALAQEGIEFSTSECSETLVNCRGVTKVLREIGVLNNKHIPDIYLTASYQQRLALLQGIVDTDGHVSLSGKTEICLSDERLAADVRRLVRSLGLKTTGRSYAHEYRHPDDPEGVYRPAKDRHRITFTTSLPVARLPRKAERIPTEARSVTDWHYIKAITPAPTEPGRCIQVDSPDHIYLCYDYIPTHNSTTLAEIIMQASFEQRDGVIGNFKPLDDTYKSIGDRLAATGHPVRYFALDDLKGRDGAFDPFKMRDPKKPDQIVPGAAQRATDLIMSVHPWGNLGQTPPGAEQRLLEWLQDGVNRHARCVGEGLRFHRDDPPPNPGDPTAASIIDPILAYARDSDMFRMFIGLSPEAEGWSTGKGLTIIERGYSSIPFPAEGTTYSDWSMSQRATAAFINSFIDGVSYGLAYRRGFFAIDEVWAVNEVDKAALQRAGRLWRQFRIYVAVTDQRISGLAHLAGFAARISVGGVRDQDEARLALEAVGAPITPDAISQMRQWAFVPGDNGKVNRGALWLHRDVTDRLVLFEQIPNPAWQVKSSDVASTFNTPGAAASPVSPAQSAPPPPAPVISET